MANIKSQIKRNRQNETRRRRNRSVRSEIKTRVRSATDAASEGRDDLDAATREAISRLDKAAAAGVLHKNTVARRKSRLLRRLRDLQTSPEG